MAAVDHQEALIRLLAQSALLFELVVITVLVRGGGFPRRDFPRRRGGWTPRSSRRLLRAEGEPLQGSDSALALFRGHLVALPREVQPRGEPG
jgi:hypothetical protein